MPELPKKHGASKRYRIPEKKPYDVSVASDADRIRSSSKWKEIRKQAFNVMPYCSDPLGLHKGVTIATEEIHHIIPLMTNSSLAFDLNNLAGLCKKCHAAVEARLRRGQIVKFSSERFVVKPSIET